MKRLNIVFGTLICSVALSRAELIEVGDVTLNNGSKITDVRIARILEDGVLLYHNRGSIIVPHNKIPEAVQDKLNQVPESQIYTPDPHAQIAASPPSVQTHTLGQREKKIVIEAYQTLVDAGAVKKTDVELGKYWIDEASWTQVNVDIKNRLLFIYSKRNEIIGHTKFITLYSYMTGKKLGKVGFFGPKYY